MSFFEPCYGIRQNHLLLCLECAEQEVHKGRLNLREASCPQVNPTRYCDECGRLMGATAARLAKVRLEAELERIEAERDKEEYE